MTDRVNALTIVLESNVRTDDVQPLIDAILHLKGVIGVEANIADSDAYIAETRARTDLGTKILDVIYPK